MRAYVKSVLYLAGTAILAMWMSTALWGQGQPVIIGESTGKDGPLDYTGVPTGTIIYFNPLDPTQFPNGVDPAHDNVFNFTKIIVPAGVTIKLTGQYLSGPVYWLASDIVDIEGTLDLSGGGGYAATNLIANRIPSIPGAGGFPGGVGGDGGTGSPNPVEPGLGPAGGQIDNCGAYRGEGGGTTVNQFLTPLIGGSGGGGGNEGGSYGAGGGAGGGAILIASSLSITINGAINGSGGNAGDYGGGGAGGSIRLVAPSLLGSGSMHADAGNSTTCGGHLASVGFIRLEAFSQGYAGAISGNQTSGTPYNTFAPVAGTTPNLTVVSVDNVPVVANPLGNFTNPDVSFSATGTVPIVVNGNNIPPNTTVTLEVYSENGPDILTSGTLLANGGSATTATISVNFPPGFSRGFISASFTPPGAPSPQSNKPKTK